MCQFVKLKVFKLFGVSFAFFVTYRSGRTCITDL
jgi:hypothetical protein